MTLDEIKNKIIDAIDSNADKIIAVGKEIQKNPELGFTEEKTSALVRRQFDALGIPYEYPVALTGVKARAKGRTSKYNVCIIGEMDALKCAGHPFADENANAHACGHNTQISALVGAAYGIQKSGILDKIDGDVTFMAVPAEEFIELSARKKLKSEGKIRYLSGKQQLIWEGAFDDVDMAMMIHAQPDEPKRKLYVKGHNLGFTAKTVTFRGKAAHGSTPYYGVNALNAAALAILGIHANRETFRDEDKIRIHPIITKGGDVVNSVPDEVCIDMYVRGASLEAIQKGESAVERAVRGAAEMISAKAEIENIPGYLPISESGELSAVFEETAAQFVGDENIVYGEEITGSSDIGDLSYLMPVIQPSIGGFSGALHSREFTVEDEYCAYILPAQILACTVAELLYNNAEKAKNVADSFKPKITKEEYINHLNS